MRTLLLLLLSTTPFVGTVYSAMEQHHSTQSQAETSLDEQLLEAVDLNHGNIELVRALIQKGADVNTCDELGRTPLHIAAMNRYLDIVQLLFESGANILATCCRGQTPLHFCRQNPCDLIQELEIVAKKSFQTRSTLALALAPRAGALCPLSMRCPNSIRAICSYLRPRDLVHSQEIKLKCHEQLQKNKDFLSAARKCNTCRVKELLLAGADINAQDIFGDNALFYVILNKNCNETLMFLLESGINYKARNLFGCKASKEAKHQNNPEAFRLIKAWPHTVRMQRRRALCMAMHARVGSNAQAQILPCHIFMQICSYL